MHTVDHGDEPAGLGPVRKRLTPKWVRYYRHKKGTKPSDAKWQEFQPHLSRVFSDLCGYCEEVCKGEVDHFRPKSRDPELVYQWSNWVLACHACNNNKGEWWPGGGYVDPCAKSPALPAQDYFEFDPKTGQIYPRPGLSPGRWKRARQTIDDLGLDHYYHQKRRIQWLEAVRKDLSRDDPKDLGHAEFVRYVTSREREFSSITRALVRDLGLPIL